MNKTTYLFLGMLWSISACTKTGICYEELGYTITPISLRIADSFYYRAYNYANWRYQMETMREDSVYQYIYRDEQLTGDSLQVQEQLLLPFAKDLFKHVYLNPYERPKPWKGCYIQIFYQQEHGDGNYQYLFSLEDPRIQP